MKIKLGEQGIVKTGEGWGFQHWDNDPEDRWQVWVDANDRRDVTDVAFAPSVVWDELQKRLLPNPGFVELEIEHYEGSGYSSSQCRHSIDIHETALVEILRRLGYEVRKP